MTDQKHTKEPSVLKQIINTLMDYINKIECQRDELREVLETAKARFHMLMIGMGPPDVDPKIGYDEIECILTKTKESI